MPPSPLTLVEGDYTLDLTRLSTLLSSVAVLAQVVVGSCKNVGHKDAIKSLDFLKVASTIGLTVVVHQGLGIPVTKRTGASSMGDDGKRAHASRPKDDYIL